MRVSNKENTIPVWERTTLTVQEAVDYTGIGREKIYRLTQKEDCDFVLWVGGRRLLKRKKLEEYIERAYSI